MKIKEFNFRGKVFDYNDVKIDCELAIKEDTEVIIMKAKHEHNNEFSEYYEENSLRPYRIRLFFGEDEKTPLFVMIIYVIDYSGGTRTACGNYYPFYKEDGFVIPHQCQGSICW